MGQNRDRKIDTTRFCTIYRYFGPLFTWTRKPGQNHQLRIQGIMDYDGWSQYNLNPFLSENISENKIRYSSGWSIRFNRLWKIEKIKNNRSAGRHIRYICCDREENQCKEMFWWIKENHYRASVPFMMMMINYFS